MGGSSPTVGGGGGGGGGARAPFGRTKYKYLVARVLLYIDELWALG